MLKISNKYILINNRDSPHTADVRKVNNNNNTHGGIKKEHLDVRSPGNPFLGDRKKSLTNDVKTNLRTS